MYLKEETSASKQTKLMEGVGVWASFWRANPHRFVSDYLGIHLKIFQCILINMMMHNNYFLYLASRGQGKTWLTAIFCVVRAMLFPGSKIIVSAGQKSQAQEVLVYIEALMKEHPMLAKAISDIKPTSSQNPVCEFHNTSFIRVVPATNGARSKRANVLVVDEFRIPEKTIIDKVLRKFLTAPRAPKYLEKPEYAHLQERNKELYLSSCWYKSHWSWEKVKTYFSKFIEEDSSYFLCGLPYQLAVKENLLMRAQVEDEMSEDDFDEVGWSIEMGCMFFGESEKAYFKYEMMSNVRQLSTVMYPPEVQQYLKSSVLKHPKKVVSGGVSEIRMVTVDVALKESKKGENDASIYTIIRLVPNSKKQRFERHKVHMEQMVGGHSETQAIRIRQLYDDFDCDFICIDTNGNGMAVYDNLVKRMTDSERGAVYEPFTCMNDDEMASRCWEDDAPEKIFAVSGTSALNTTMAIQLRDDIKSGKFLLPIMEVDAKVNLSRLKGYHDLDIEQKNQLLMPYIQTSMFINETINLSNEGVAPVVKLVEPRSGRKDRYKSVEYGNYFASTLEKEYFTGTGTQNTGRYTSLFN